MNSVYGDGPVWTRALMNWGRFKRAERLCVVVVIILNVAHHLALMQNFGSLYQQDGSSQCEDDANSFPLLGLCLLTKKCQLQWLFCTPWYLCHPLFFCYSPFSIIVLYDSKNVVCALYNYRTATKENCQLFCLCWMVSVMFPAESSLIDQFLLLSSWDAFAW